MVRVGTDGTVSIFGQVVLFPKAKFRCFSFAAFDSLSILDVIDCMGDGKGVYSYVCLLCILLLFLHLSSLLLMRVATWERVQHSALWKGTRLGKDVLISWCVVCCIPI